jgi:hypothetical protein
MVGGPLRKLTIAWLRYLVNYGNFWGAIKLVVLGSEPCISCSLQVLLGICNCLEWLCKILVIKRNIIVDLRLLIVELLFWSWIKEINHIQSDIIVSERLRNRDTQSELLIEWIDLFEGTGRFYWLLVALIVLTTWSLIIFRSRLLISLILRSLIHFFILLYILLWFEYF